MNQQQVLQALLQWSGVSEKGFDHSSLSRMRGYLLDVLPSLKKQMLFFTHIVGTCQLHLLEDSPGLLPQKKQEIDQIYGEKGTMYLEIWLSYLLAKKEQSIPLLVDGQRINLPHEFFDGVTMLRCSWRNKMPNSGLGMGAFLLSHAKKIDSLADIIDDNNRTSNCRSVYKEYDNDPSQDTIHFYLPSLASHVHTILLWLQLYPNPLANFSAVDNLQVRLADAHQCFFRYQPQAYSGSEKILLLGSIYKSKSSQWRFKAGVGGLKGGLNALKRKYI